MTALLRQSAAAAQERGEFRLAELLNQEILSRHPDDSEATRALSALIADEEDAAPAALTEPEALLRRAADLAAQGRSTAALAVCDAAVAADPRSADAYILRGNLQRDLCLFEEALESFQTALTQRDDAPTKFALGCLYLLSGDLAQGWPLYDQYHWTEKGEPRPSSHRDLQPNWDGDDDLSGKVLLLTQDQGDPETLQFARYALLAQARGATVVLSVQDRLRRLLLSLSPDIHVVGEGPALQACDYRCALSALPGIFNATLESIPDETRYLRAEPARTNRWRKLLDTGDFLVGVCWRGDAHGPDDRRSFPLRLLEPISKLPGVRLISLQDASGVEELGDLPAGMNVETLGPDFESGPDAFIDTAAVIECLDLVITCDSPIAHLAGCLGARTWVALPTVPDWRWLLERQDSPWYPTLRLFRQAATQDFAAVIAVIGAEICALLESTPVSKSASICAPSEALESPRPLPHASRASRTLRRPWLHRRAPELVSGILVALMCTEIVNAVRILVPHKTLLRVTTGIPAFSGPAKIDLNPIASAHLFGEIALAQDPASAPPTAAALNLTGTLSTDDPRHGLAIIGEEGQFHVYSVGQAVGDVLLEGIYRDRVVVQRNGQLESLFLPRKSMGLQPVLAKVQPVGFADVAPSVEPDAPIQKFADSNLETDVQGNLLGIRVVPGKDRVGFAHSGLIGGDIVVAMNGQKIDSESSADIWRQASTGTAVTVLRRGVLKEVTLNLSD